jgi:hypothetical protein
LRRERAANAAPIAALVVRANSRIQRFSMFMAGSFERINARSQRGKRYKELPLTTRLLRVVFPGIDHKLDVRGFGLIHAGASVLTGSGSARDLCDHQIGVSVGVPVHNVGAVQGSSVVSARLHRRGKGELGEGQNHCPGDAQDNKPGFVHLAIPLQKRDNRRRRARRPI